MIVPWNDEVAASWIDDLSQLKYASHLMRQNAKLFGPVFQVSTKTRHINIFGQSEEVLHFTDYNQNPSISSHPQLKTEIKITDLSIEPLQKIISLETISTELLILSLAKARLNPLELVPSVMALLHAVIPHQAILYCQPAAVLGLACTVEGMALLAKEAKEPFPIIPLMIPGLELAKKCLHCLKDTSSASHTSDIQVLVLKGQGVLVLGETLEQVFKKLSSLIDTSLSIVKLNKIPEDADSSYAIPRTQRKTNLSVVASLRKEFSISAGHPLLMHCDEFTLKQIPDLLTNNSSSLAIQSFASATPQTRIKAMVGLDTTRYKDDYTHLLSDLLPGNCLGQDFSPRIILDPPSSLFALGQSATEALLTQELFMWDQNISMVARLTGTHQALPILDLLQYEAFCLEEKSVLHRYQTEKRLGKVFQGEIALVTGGASGIGKACVQALLEQGAAVISLDINPVVINQFDTPEYLGLVCDLTNESEVIAAFEQAALAFGGLDMLVLNQTILLIY